MYPLFLATTAAEWLAVLEKEIAFPAQRPIIVGGVNVREPRDVVFYGLEGISAIQYARLRRCPAPMPPCVCLLLQKLSKIREHMAQLMKRPMPVLNAVLINHYRDGFDSMGFHSDNYDAMGPEPLILSVSFGAARKFVVKTITNTHKHTVTLSAGSVFVMYGKTIQQHWHHALPKTNLPCLPRWNLSFCFHIQRQEEEQNAIRKLKKHQKSIYFK